MQLFRSVPRVAEGEQRLGWREEKDGDYRREEEHGVFVIVF